MGSNTLLCVVGSVDGDGSVQVADDAAYITRLGEGIDRNGCLSDAAMHRTLSVVERAVARAREHGCDVLALVATSAVREASNGGRFLERVRAIVGDDVRAVSSDEEARLTFLGAEIERDRSTDRRALVFDIGGGSTEFAVGTLGAQPDWTCSVSLGSVRLSERFGLGAPCDPRALASLDAAIAATLADVRPPEKGRLVGLAATMTTLAALGGVDVGRSGAIVSRASIAECFRRLCDMSFAERCSLSRLDPARADVIVAGAAIALGVLARFEAQSTAVSMGGVRIGLLRSRWHTLVHSRATVAER